MDFARREYTSRARFFRDDPTEVEIQWYRVPEDAPPLGFPSVIMSAEWTKNGYDEAWRTQVGEVWDAERPYKFHGELIDPNYAHVCGTESDFANGAVFNPDLDVKYDEQGLPICCGQPATPLAGVVIGMEVEVVVPIVWGADCTTAGEVVIPADIIAPAPAPFAFLWAEMIDFPAGDWKFVYDRLGGGGRMQIWRGTSCMDAALWADFVFDGTSVLPLDPVTWRYWLVFLDNFVGNDNQVTITLEP